MTEIDYDALARRLVEHMSEGTFARPLLSPKTLAERLEVSERTARELIGNGTIPSFLVGGSRRIDPREVDRFLERLQRDE